MTQRLTYPKIETVFDRGPDFTVIDGALRRPEYGLINEWVLTEKVDGMNIRLVFTRDEPEDDNGYDYRFDVRGKSDNAQVPPELLNKLRDECHRMLSDIAVVMDVHDLETYVLYGEGYGPKIQSGGRYRSDQGFILFDVRANSAWLDEDQVTDTAERLGLQRVPAIANATTIQDAVELTRHAPFASDVAEVYDESFIAEGVVAKTRVPLYDRRGDRIMWKLKAKDWRPGKR